MITKPEPGEYSAYNANYINLIGDEDVLDLLIRSKKDTHAMFSNIPVHKEEYAYETGKWTIKEVVSHMIDTERIFAYRLLAISRGEQQPLPGFEQDDYAKLSFANDRVLDDLADEFRTVREGSLYLIQNLNDEQLNLMGTASGNRLSVRALVYLIAGHERHHLRVLKERYL